MVSNELQHHGILGQKWGVRRYQNRDGSLTPAGKKRYSDDFVNAHSKKSIREMSDEELRSRLNRLQMEQNYTKIVSSGTRVSKGKKLVGDVIKAGTTVASITTTALTIYNNIDKVKKIIGK